MPFLNILIKLNQDLNLLKFSSSFKWIEHQKLLFILLFFAHIEAQYM